MNYVALIPARAGSKSIPRKNTATIGGKPLIWWVCNVASRCERIDAVYVSTEDEITRKLVDSFGLGKVACVDRADHTTTDYATTESVLLDFTERVSFENLVLIQATSPLLSVDDISNAISVFEEGFDSVLSLVRQKRFIWAEDDTGAVRPINYDPSRRPMRQDNDGFLVENGALYITSRKNLAISNCRLNGRVGFVEMNEDSYVELDTLADWTMVDALLRHTQTHGQEPFN